MSENEQVWQENEAPQLVSHTPLDHKVTTLRFREPRGRGPLGVHKQPLLHRLIFEGSPQIERGASAKGAPGVGEGCHLCG